MIQGGHIGLKFNFLSFLCKSQIFFEEITTGKSCYLDCDLTENHCHYSHIYIFLEFSRFSHKNSDFTEFSQKLKFSELSRFSRFSRLVATLSVSLALTANQKFNKKPFQRICFEPTRNQFQHGLAQEGTTNYFSVNPINSHHGLGL